VSNEKIIMNQKTLLLIIILATFLFGCENEPNENPNNELESELVTITPLEELNQVDKLLSKIADKPEHFKISSDLTSTITGKKGTIIYVNPDHLETVDGSPLGDSIQIELLEMTNQSSLLLNNAQTVSNNEILISGGAYYLNMLSDGKQLKIKQGNGLKVEFPILTENEMGLYLGERDSLGQINWVQTKRIFELKDNSVDLVDEVEKVTKPTKPLKKGIEDNRVMSIVFDDSVMFPELQHYDNVNFRVNDDCEYNPEDSEKFWYNVALSKSKVYGEYVIIFDGYEESGKKLRKKYNVTPVFTSEDYQVAIKDYEDKYNEYLKKQAEIEKAKADIEFQQKTYEAIELLNFGWINCDRFIESTSPRINIQLSLSNESLSAARIYAVFKNINSIISEKYSKGQKEKIAFKNIPEGMELTIIAISSKDETPYYFEKKVNTKSSEQIQIKFKATTQENIKQKIERLN
jgi:hypothetical protein